MCPDLEFLPGCLKPIYQRPSGKIPLPFKPFGHEIVQHSLKLESLHDIFFLK